MRTTRKTSKSEARPDRFCVISASYWIPAGSDRPPYAPRRAPRRFFPSVEAATLHAQMLMEKDKAQGFTTPELFVVEVRRIVRPRPVVQYDIFNVRS